MGLPLEFDGACNLLLGMGFTCSQEGKELRAIKRGFEFLKVLRRQWAEEGQCIPADRASVFNTTSD